MKKKIMYLVAMLVSLITIVFAKEGDYVPNLEQEHNLAWIVVVLGLLITIGLAVILRKYRKDHGLDDQEDE